MQANGAITPLSERDLRKLRGGLSLFMIGFAVPILVLTNVRFLLAGAYVSPQASEVVGLIATILMVVSGLIGATAMRNARQGNGQKALAYLGATLLLGLAAFIVIGIQVVNQSVSTVEHFGMIFLTSLGAIELYIVGALLAMWSAHIRGRKFGLSVDNYWGVESTVLFWQLTVVGWFVLYVVLYLI
jgi:cytochrome c oxidase subunit 3